MSRKNQTMIRNPNPRSKRNELNEEQKLEIKEAFDLFDTNGTEKYFQCLGICDIAHSGITYNIYIYIYIFIFIYV
ncbi:hypothetical protein PFFCH_04363 [Plasmodium falciparum FCH/4]|uniref:Uncharacterized protein n=1 Tax=Plasmodium falciparum FCH/4 TaxID=1036724 RepID=A0A024VJY0_PLAFA|nr:hypothetical protein PFFCH_04363 [Plasmodium falciparum FCH/4]